MCFFVYILKNEIGRYYTGYTDNLSKRLKKHNAGGTRSTRNKGRWDIVYFENFEKKCEAISREKYIKKKKSKNYIENLIQSRGVEK